MSKSVHSKGYRALLARLREARRAAGLTQQQVAKRLKKPQSYVSKCELGERRLDPMELKVLAEIYGKRYDFFTR
jgi:transcriptional regulator with XRE-family HTH domain